MSLTITGGTPAYAVTAFTLPAGLTATVSGGAVSITGTPTATGTSFSGSVTIRDSVGATVTNNFTLTINPPIAFNLPALPAYTA
jgi:Putative Ig domain